MSFRSFDPPDDLERPDDDEAEAIEGRLRGLSADNASLRVENWRLGRLVDDLEAKLHDLGLENETLRERLRLREVKGEVLACAASLHLVPAPAEPTLSMKPWKEVKP